MSKWYFSGVAPGSQWWTDSDDTETISFTPKAMVQYDPLRTAERLQLGSGYGTHYPHGGGARARISYSLGEDEDMADRHVALLSVLREGHAVSFAQNTTDAWAVGLVDPDRGETVVPYSGSSPFALYQGIDDPVDGSVCLLQSALPELRREIVELTDVDTVGEDVTLAGRGTGSGLVYSHTTTTDMGVYPILRPLYFFPFIRLLPGQKNPLRQVNGMPWVFDAWFIVDTGLENEVIGAPPA